MQFILSVHLVVMAPVAVLEPCMLVVALDQLKPMFQPIDVEGHHVS